MSRLGTARPQMNNRYFNFSVTVTSVPQKNRSKIPVIGISAYLHFRHKVPVSYTHLIQHQKVALQSCTGNTRSTCLFVSCVGESRDSEPRVIGTSISTFFSFQLSLNRNRYFNFSVTVISFPQKYRSKIPVIGIPAHL